MKSSQSQQPPLVALYARVSTRLAQDPEVQLRDLREYVSRRGWTIVAEFIDRTSGATELRPALNRMMMAAHQRKFDVVAVWKIDRFGRSLRHLVNALAELEGHGIAFVSLRDNLDLSTPSGRLMFQIVGATAEFERSLIRASPRRAPQYSRKGQATWTARSHRGRRENYPVARSRRLVGSDRKTNGDRRRHSAKSCASSVN